MAWSDPVQQLSVGKFSPAAKTLMERVALARGEAEGVRVAILCPSMIVGDSLSDTPSGVLRFLKAVLEARRSPATRPQPRVPRRAGHPGGVARATCPPSHPARGKVG